MAPSAVDIEAPMGPVLTKKTPNQDLKSSASPLPKVLTFDAETTSIDELVQALKVAGGVVIKNCLTLEDTNQIEKDVRPWLEKDKPWTNGNFFPPETRRAFGVIGKSRTFAERMVMHPLWLGVTEALLTSEVKHNWVGDKNETSKSGPQVNNTIIFSIGPGAADQALHRDDPIHHVYFPAAAEHHLGRDAGIGFFVAGKKTTRANGATRFIPGSHLWDYAEGPAKESQTFYAELEPGDGFMVLSGCFHGGSANNTEEERLVYSTFSTRGYLRQEENQYLANSMEDIKKLPEAIQERVGYGLSAPFLGWVNLANPMLVLHPEGVSHKDLW